MDFQNINWQVSGHGQIVCPQYLGDCELSKLEMKLEAAEITLESYFRDISLPESLVEKLFVTKIICTNVTLLSLSSDHLQNVVDEVLLFDRDIVPFEDLRLDAFPECHDKIRSDRNSRFLLVITPITGIDAFVLCQKVSFRQSI
jgi:hypothetical protein